MGDDISGGNGFQEYLMVEKMKSMVRGFEVKEDRSNRVAVFGKGVNKRVQHTQENKSFAYSVTLAYYMNYTGVCAHNHLRVIREIIVLSDTPWKK